jgi:hypothetical protein
MSAIPFTDSPYKFSTEIEKLSNQLMSTYINEGVPHDTALSYSTHHTMETLIKKSRGNETKTVLRSGNFYHFNEVINKYVEVATLENDRYKARQYRNNNNNNKNFNKNKFSNNKFNNNNNNNNYRNNSNGYRNNNNNNQSNRSNYSGQRTQNNTNNNNKNVRVTNAENCDAEVLQEY